MRTNGLYGGLACFVALALGLSACTTLTGDGQLERTVYATHRNVQKLDKELSGSVAKLNETAAELDARVEGSDAQMRRVEGMLEETQYKLDTVYAALDELRATLYDHLNLSPPPRDRRSEFRPTTGVTVRQDEIQVLPPAEEAEPAGLEPMQALESRQPTGGNPVADYRTAQTALTQKNYQEALSLFDAYLERYPGTELCARAQYWKAFCYRRLGKAEEAVAEYEKVRKEYPNSERAPSSLRNEAVVLIELGQTDQAEALLEELIEKYPMSPAAEGAKAALESLRGN